MRCLVVLLLAACSKQAPHTPADPPNANDDVRQSWNRHFEKQETGPGMCAAGGLDKTCKTDADCVLVEEIFDECRTTGQFAVSRAGKATFDAAGHTDPCAHKECPACVVRWHFTEDCAASPDPVVACDAGRCLTHAKPEP